jgi:hypothetical protein
VEAITKLLRAAKWEALGSRAVHIPKILAVVHLKKIPLPEARPEPRAEVAALVPNLYRRTPSGMQDLVSDGLASVLPYFPATENGDRFGSLGRQFLASRLLDRSKIVQDTFKWLEGEPDATKSELLRIAHQDDLNG